MMSRSTAAVANALATSMRGGSMMARPAFRGIVEMADISLQCSDGIQLAAQSWKMIDSLAMGQQEQELQEDQHRPSPSLHRILCLHGWMDNCRSFHKLAPYLVQNLPDTELVALDFPGHGWSSHKSIDGTPAVVAELVFYVAEAVKELNWDQNQPIVLIGHSMGAAVTSMFAASFPERVQGIVLLEGAGPLSRNPADISKHIREHILRRQEGNRIHAKQPRTYPSMEVAVNARCMTARNFPGKQWLSQEAAKELVERGTRPVVAEGAPSGGVQFRHDPRLHWPSLMYMSDQQTEAILRKIQCPIALLLANDGWPFGEGALEKCMSLLKPIRYKKLAGSHHFHADPETADAVAEEVLSFLAQQQQRSKH